jgi:hypothetical protein
MSDLNERNASLSRIMMKSKVEMPCRDLESVVMANIHRESQTRAILKSKWLSILFLIGEIAFGVLINFSLAGVHIPIVGIPPDRVLVFFQIGCIVLFFFQLERCLLLTPKRKQKYSFTNNQL